MTTTRLFWLHCASQSAMNTTHCLTRIRFALVLRKIHFTLDGKFDFCGICIVMHNDVTTLNNEMNEQQRVLDLSKQRQRNENISNEDENKNGKTNVTDSK